MGFYDFRSAGSWALDLLRALMAPRYDVAAIDGDSRPLQGPTSAWAVGSMLMTWGDQMALHYRRTAPMIRQDHYDDIFLQLLHRGSLLGDFAGTEIRASAGEILCYDRVRPLSLWTSDNQSATLSIPRVSLERLAVPLNDVHGLVLRGVAADQLREHLLAMALHGSEGGQRASLSATTVTLVAAALRQHPYPRSERERQRALRLRAVIESRLGDEELSAASICQAAGVSRSALYRDFEEFGGVERYIVGRRLSMARNRLAKVPDRTITEVAFDLGFKSSSHFSTAYRTRFGISPRETVKGPASSRDETLIKDRLRLWETMTDAIDRRSELPFSPTPARSAGGGL